MKIGKSLEKSSAFIDRRVSVAPMMDWTDRHCRYFLRCISPNVLLYTEMITAMALLRGDRERLLRFDPAEHPVALQLGGSEPDDLAVAARLGEQYGYDEINLNCGCPSDKVQRGSFGACLMAEPARVADCVAAMRSAVRIPVTVKMRIGTVTGGTAQTAADVQKFDAADYDALCGFVAAVAQAGCEVAIVHARKAVLGGWSPKDNRDVPPLRYDAVWRLRQDFPALTMIVNGGVRRAEEAVAMLEHCDGVMLGREAYHRPLVLAEIDRLLASGSSDSPPVSVGAVLNRMADYAELEMSRGERLASITRHMLGLVTHSAGAREYRRMLSEGARVPGAGPELIRRAAVQFS
jgi:tRNA-dihydrouridine synthase A